MTRLLPLSLLLLCILWIIRLALIRESRRRRKLLKDRETRLRRPHGMLDGNDRFRAAREHGSYGERHKVWVLAVLFAVAISGCRMPGVDTQNPNYHYTTAPKTNAMAPFNLLPAVSTRAFVSHAPPAPVTNLVVTWDHNYFWVPYGVSMDSNHVYHTNWLVEWLDRSPSLPATNWIGFATNVIQRSNLVVISNAFPRQYLRAGQGWGRMVK